MFPQLSGVKMLTMDSGNNTDNGGSIEPFSGILSETDKHRLNCYEFVSLRLFGKDDVLGSWPNDEIVGKYFDTVSGPQGADAVIVGRTANVPRPFFMHMALVDDAKSQIQQVANDGEPVTTMDLHKFVETYGSNGKEITWLKKKNSGHFKVNFPIIRN